MAFKDQGDQENAVTLLQRSLERGRLGHAYLFAGPDQGRLETAAANLAKTLNCEQPVRSGDNTPPIDSCGACLNCRKINEVNHPDVQWIRPESKSRVITIDQMRQLMQTINLKPTQGRWKVAVIVAADRLNEQAANAFLKTLEEPPGDSVLILVSTDPQRMLETILSRCLRLNFSGEAGPVADADIEGWLRQFSRDAAAGARGLLSRYRLLSVFLNRLNEVKERIGEALSDRSPLEQYEDLDPRLKEKWETELSAAIEAEYRHQRRQMLVQLQWWFRDVWLATMQLGGGTASYPQLSAEVEAVAGRLTTRAAMANLQQLEQTQRLLTTNAQEALVLEVGLLKLQL